MPRSPASLSGLYFNTDVTKTTAVSLANIAALQGLIAVTVEAWIYLFAYPPSNSGKVFAFAGGSNTGFQFQLNTGNGALSIQVGNSTTSVTSGGITGISLNTWHKVEGTWDGANVYAFLDGVKGGVNALAGGNTGNPLSAPFIGTTNGQNRAFPGIISEVRISNTTRHTASYTPETQPLAADANTIGLYHLNEGQGTVANDSSAQANNGTLTGSPLPVWSEGKFLGGGTSRTNATNRVSVQNFMASLSSNASTSVDTGLKTDNTQFSGAFWYRPNSNVTGAETMWSSTDGTNGFAITHDSQNTLHYMQSILAGASTFNKNFGRLTGNSWSHFAYTITNGAMIGYLNGVQAFSTNSSMPSASANNLKLFAAGAGNRGSMCGYILHNGSLWTPSQVLALYQSGLVPAGATQILPLTEGAGTTAFDTSGNGNNGTITSGTYASDVPIKARQTVGGNLIYNGNFEYAPPVNVSQTAGSRWIDGTAGGSLTNSLFGWNFLTLVGTSSTEFDSANAHSNGYGLRVSTGAVSSLGVIGSGSGPAAGFIPVLPSTSYTFSGFIKTNLISGSATTGASLFIQEYTGAGSFITSHAANPNITSTTPWTPYTVTFTTNTSARYLRPIMEVAGNDGAATLIMDAWFDDIVLVPTANTTRGLAI